ncbi:ZP domain-containing protein [Nephila pilipes]|uniref:ZP domain-containing protein n=1 Tax=Nephila pilipes TaxID=299642 RepID=A0A8X6TGV2_NEPPI|nr:ZP domain-containing protein [Nephila pilipes]
MPSIMDPRLFIHIEWTCLAFLMMLGLVICNYDNSPRLDVSCDATGLHLKISFSKPFNGIVFANGYKFDPLCSTSSDTPSVDEFLTLPLIACGTDVDQNETARVINTIVIQHHRLLETKYDLVEIVTCQLPEPLVDLFWISRNSLGQAFGYDAPQQKPQLELDLKHGKQISKYGNKEFALFLVLQLRNKELYNDIYVKDCIVHDSEILDENTSAYHITDPAKCSNENSKMLSTFEVDSSGKGLMAYTELLPTDLKGKFYFTCEAILCKDTCKCPDVNKLPAFHLTKMVPHRLNKRSIASVPENSKSHDTNRYLKSTIKVLTEKLMKYRKQSKARNNTTLDKRIWTWIEVTTPYERDSKVEVIAQTDTYVPEPVSTVLYNVEPHVIDIYNVSSDELDNSEFNETLSTDGLLPMTETTIATEIWTKELIMNTTVRMPNTEDSKDLVLFINETEDCKNLDSVTTCQTITYDLNKDHGNCLPRLHFIITFVALGFIVLCLLLICCGMALYIRKEKKKHLIDSFLLYNFY